MNSRERTAQTALVYLGPSFYGVIQKGTVTSGEPSPKLRRLTEAHPFLYSLFVPVTELAEKRKQLKKADSELGQLYRKAEQLKEGRHV